jgi:hypothetical protein
MNTASRSLTITNINSNQPNDILIEFNATGDQKSDHDLLESDKSLQKAHPSVDETKKLADISVDYCQDVFACLVCVLLLNIGANVFKDENALAPDELSFILGTLWHHLNSPTKQTYSRKEQKSIQSYRNKTLNAQQRIFQKDTLDFDAFGNIFDRLCLDFSILAGNVKKSATKFILEQINANSPNSKTNQLLNDIYTYHNSNETSHKKARIDTFNTNIRTLLPNDSTNLFDNLFLKNNSENSQDNGYIVNQNLEAYQLSSTLDEVLIKYNKKNSSKINQQTMLGKIKDKINNGLINAAALAKAVKAFGLANESEQREILHKFLSKALLEKGESELIDSCWVKPLLFVLVIGSVTLKMTATLLLDSAFFFGVALTFAGFSISFVNTSKTSLAISITLGVITLAIWYGAGFATWFSRVDKIRKKISSSFSIEEHEPEKVDGKKTSHPKTRKNMKLFLLFIVAPIAAVASGLPAFYGVLKTVSKLGSAFGCSISESQTWLISIGLALAVGSAISFFCFYTFKLNSSVDKIIEKWQNKDNSFFFITICFTFILGVVYFFAIKGALSELADFFLSHHFNALKLNNQMFASVCQSQLFFAALFGSLMLINFFSVIDYTARLIKPSQPPLTQTKNKVVIPLDTKSDKIEDQENKQILAKARHDLGTYTKFKLSIAIIDVAAFSVFGGIKASNGVLENWNCAHFEEGKLIYNDGTLGSNAVLIGSCSVLLIAIAGIWRYRKTLRMSYSTAALSSAGLLFLTGTFIFYPSSTSLFFALIVIAANIFVSLAFTHFVNTFLLGVDVKDEAIKEPDLSSFKHIFSERETKNLSAPILTNKLLSSTPV